MSLRTILFAAALALPAGGAFADICADVNGVVASAADLSPLRGAKSDSTTWDATKSVTGFDSCSIETYKDSLIYACSKVLGKRDDMLSSLTSMANAVWACSSVTSRSMDEYKDTGYETSWDFFVNDKTQIMMSGGSAPFSRGAYQIRLSMFEDR